MSTVLKNQVELPLQDRRKFKPQNFIHTSLFSEVYVFNDIPMQFKPLWDRIEDHGRFDQFFNGLVTLMESFSLEDAYKWNHTDTLNNLIFPMLEILGYGDAKSRNNSILENCSLSITNEDGSQIDLKPSLLFCEDEAGKNYIKNSTKANSKAELKKYLKFPIQTSYYGSVFDRKSNKYEFKKDEIGKRGDVLTNLGPNDQMAEYLKIFNVDWGIFTDGAVWRLYRKEMSASYSEKYYEFDFNDLYNLYRTSAENQHDEHSEFFEIAKYMFWFFSYDGLIKGPSVVPFVEKVYQESQKYVANIEEDLKERFVHAMTISCNGYLESVREKGQDVNLKLIAKTSESLIFNLIFIRSCESKRVLPVHQDYIHVSLKALVDKIRHFSYNNEYDASARIVKQGLKDIFNKEIRDDGYDIYEYIQRLHEMVESGNNGFGITGFVESVFYPDERSFYKKYKINNKEMIKLVYQLFYNFNNGKNVQIPYSLITPRQLGSVYESFLEFQPMQTSTKMFYVKKSSKGKAYWQWVEQKEVKKEDQFHLAFVDKKGIVFSPNNEERKTTGSYYTPDTIVDYIVKETLGDLCKGKSVQEILKIKVCDPAMGSGHFLLGALDFLAKKIAEKGESKNFVEIKRDVLDSSIYGSDINESAVKLGKMSLWLATALPGKKLERLSDQLKTVNSLYLKDYSKDLWPGIKISAFLGNPPWGATSFQAKDLKAKAFQDLDLRNINTFDLFIRLSVDSAMKSKGRVGFLIPRNYIRGEAYSSLRNLCIPGLHKIIETGQFPGVVQEACAIILNYENKTSHFEFDTSLIGQKEVSGAIEKNKIEAPFFKFQVNKNDALDEVVEKMKKFDSFGTLYDVKRGIECGKNGELVKCPSCGLHTSPPKKKNDKGGFSKKCKCGFEITLKLKSFNMITTEKTLGSVPVLTGPDIKKGEFKAKRWIKTGLKGVDYKEELCKTSERIYISKNSHKVIAAYDSVGKKYFIMTLYACLPVKKGLPHQAITSILNSNLMRFFYEYTINSGGSLTNSIMVSGLEQLPIALSGITKDKALSEEDVYKLFGLSGVEMKLIESFVKDLP